MLPLNKVDSRTALHHRGGQRYLDRVASSRREAMAKYFVTGATGFIGGRETRPGGVIRPGAGCPGWRPAERDNTHSDAGVFRPRRHAEPRARRPPPAPRASGVLLPA